MPSFRSSSTRPAKMKNKAPERGGEKPKKEGGVSRGGGTKNPAAVGDIGGELLAPVFGGVEAFWRPPGSRLVDGGFHGGRIAVTRL